MLVLLETLRYIMALLSWGLMIFYKELNFEEYIGKRIGVLRTDIEGREVLVRTKN